MEPITRLTESQPNADAETLRQIASDIETYLGKWVVRSRRVIEQGRGSTLSDVTMSTQVQKLEAEQRKWEARRQREMDDIADKAEELAAAWLKLEAEQRQFSQMKETWQHRTHQAGNTIAAGPAQDNVVALHSETDHQTHVAAAPVVPARPAVPQYTPQVAPRLPSNADYASDRPACGNSRDLAIRQFEQLRREVGTKQRS